MQLSRLNTESIENGIRPIRKNARGRDSSALLALGGRFDAAPAMSASGTQRTYLLASRSHTLKPLSPLLPVWIREISVEREADTFYQGIDAKMKALGWLAAFTT